MFPIRRLGTRKVCSNFCLFSFAFPIGRLGTREVCINILLVFVWDNSDPSFPISRLGTQRDLVREDRTGFSIHNVSKIYFIT